MGMWEDHQELFDWDGSWRDVYVLDTHLHDWQQLLAYLQKRHYHLLFISNDVAHPLPVTIETIFARRAYYSPLLRIMLNKIQIHCHFFCVEQIEFDIDPREITDADTFTMVLNFMADVGDAVGKEVRLTPENAVDYVLLRYNPVSRQIEAGLKLS